MPRKSRRKVTDDRGPLQRLLDRERLEQEQSALDIITPEMRAKGGYVGDGRRIVNRGGTPVARWDRAGKLSDSQMSAIELCVRLWSILGRETRVIAIYGAFTGKSDGIETEQARLRYIDAKEDLARIRGYFTGLDAWWDCFENVCRWDEPAGVAGSRLGVIGREAEFRALTTVCFVADIIATRENLTVPVGRIRVA